LLKIINENEGISLDRKVVESAEKKDISLNQNVVKSNKNEDVSLDRKVAELPRTNESVFCRSCGKQIKSEAEICPHCGVRQKKDVRSLSPKSPGIAAIASFLFAGLGQIYNGEFIKGFLFMIVQVINLLLMFLVIGFITYPIVWAIGIYDAYRSAEKINAIIAEA